MLKKRSRINKNEVEKLFKKGKSLHTGYFIVRSRINEKNYCRFCIIFTKNTSLKSHERNAFRRRIYETIRKNFTIINNHIDAGFIIKNSLLTVPLKTAREKIEPAVIDGLKALKKIYG